MPDLKVENGIVLLCTASEVLSPSGAELLGYKYSLEPLLGFTQDSIDVSESFQSVKFRRQPASITYTPNTSSGDLYIQPTVGGIFLDQPQVSCILNNGYFIDDAYKLFTVMAEDIATLLAVTEDVDLNGKLQRVAELRSAGELAETEENIVVSLVGQTDGLLDIEQSGVLLHPLYPYQRYGVRWLQHCCINSLGTILGDDMGLGKTAQIIALIAESFTQRVIDRAMIVVPNSLLENWRREFEFFCPSIRPYLHYGSVRSGLVEDLSRYTVVILPYTIMSSDIEMLIDIDVSLLVFDEASVLKNPESARSVAAGRLNARAKIAMTGTPVENNLLDVWSISNIVSPGYLGDKTGFKKRYMEKNISDTLENDLSGLESTISQIMLRRMKVDVLEDLPEKIDIHQPILMPNAERIEYDNIVSDIRNNAEDGARVLQEITKLQQFTSHPCLTDGVNVDLNVDQLLSRSAKLSRLIELLEEIASRSEKVLIFANHLAAIDLLQRLVKEKFGIDGYNIDGRVDPLERQNRIDLFSGIEGFSVLILNPKTAGMGLNITSANHVIHYSRQWNPALEEQATSRAFRNGQTKDVNAYYLFYADTIEEVIDERLRLKRQLADSVVSVVDIKANELDFFIEHI